MTSDETGDVLALLAIEYDGTKITPERIDLWTELFRDVAFADAKGAVIAWFQDAEKGRFFPRPAELRALVRSTKPALDNALYREYMRLRFKLQADTLTAADDRAMAGVERRLGIARSERTATRPLVELVQR